ncbi:SycD/LcrH family type III secretion system chaperone [Kistimonas asteriae]|uniref:SycD/LcrH family type III secretion system chaperone n=1 Tax=Kistimonas asteriae TaxID=517724 RepID=UPI001BA5D7F2
METEQQDFSAGDYEGMLSDFLSRGGTFKDLKDMSEDSMEAIYSVAYNLYEGGKYDDAIKVFQFLCFYDHYCKKYFLGLGACLLMQKEYDRAIEVFGYVCAIDTTDPQAMLYIGDCHLAAGDSEAACVAYQAAVDWAGDQAQWQDEKQRAQGILDSLKDGE